MGHLAIPAFAIASVENSVKVLFHFIGRPVRLGPDARRTSDSPEWIKRPRPIGLGRSLGRPTVCLPETNESDVRLIL